MFLHKPVDIFREFEADCPGDGFEPGAESRTDQFCQFRDIVGDGLGRSRANQLIVRQPKPVRGVSLRPSKAKNIPARPVL